MQFTKNLNQERNPRRYLARFTPFTPTSGFRFGTGAVEICRTGGARNPDGTRKDVHLELRAGSWPMLNSSGARTFDVEIEGRDNPTEAWTSVATLTMDNAGTPVSSTIANGRYEEMRYRIVDFDGGTADQAGMAWVDGAVDIYPSVPFTGSLSGDINNNRLFLPAVPARTQNNGMPVLIYRVGQPGLGNAYNKIGPVSGTAAEDVPDDQRASGPDSMVYEALKRGWAVLTLDSCGVNSTVLSGARDDVIQGLTVIMNTPAGSAQELGTPNVVPASGTDPAGFDACVQNAYAIQWARANADTYGFDPEAIMLWGDFDAAFSCFLLAYGTTREPVGSASFPSTLQSVFPNFVGGRQPDLDFSIVEDSARVPFAAEDFSSAASTNYSAANTKANEGDYVTGITPWSELISVVRSCGLTTAGLLALSSAGPTLSAAQHRTLIANIPYYISVDNSDGSSATKIAIRSGAASVTEPNLVGLTPVGLRAGVQGYLFKEAMKAGIEAAGIKYKRRSVARFSRLNVEAASNDTHPDYVALQDSYIQDQGAVYRDALSHAEASFGVLDLGFTPRGAWMDLVLELL